MSKQQTNSDIWKPVVATGVPERRSKLTKPHHFTQSCWHTTSQAINVAHSTPRQAHATNLIHQLVEKYMHRSLQ